MPTEIQTASDEVLLVRQVSCDTDRSYPAGATHAIGDNYFRKARGGAYR